MAEVKTCPALEDYLVGDQCLEEFAGVSSVFYVGLKKDLNAPLKATDNVYATPTFKPGTGLYKFECKDEANNIEGSSLGKRKGFKQTYNLTLEAANKVISKFARGLNNLDIFIIVPDGEESQIMYDPVHQIKLDADAIKLATGSAATDERQTTIAATLGPVKHPFMYVTAPLEGGWDSLLKSKTSPEAA